jgi:glycosyltransferase involved in cell wall biosynthesis
MATNINFKRYRIAHLTSAHPPLDGRIYNKECRSLVRAGYDVLLIGNFDLTAVVDGVKVHGLGANKGRVQRFTIKLVRIIREAFRADANLYHVHDPDLLIVGLILRAAGRRVVYDVHEDLPTKILIKLYLPRYMRKPLQWIVERVEGWLAGCMSGLVTATPYLKNRFLRAHKMVVAVNNFPILEELVCSASVDWASRSGSVTYYGGISEARGIAEMLAAMDLLSSKHSIKLELAGWFYVKKLLNDLSATSQWRHVQWHGELKREDLTPLLGRSFAGLVILHPEKTFVASQPTKLFEYMAAGIPVIASDFPLWRSFVQETDCGVLVDPLNPKAIAEAIEYLALNPREAEAMGQRGKKAVERLFNWANEEQTLIAFYSSLLATQAVPDAEAVAT